MINTLILNCISADLSYLSNKPLIGVELYDLPIYQNPIIHLSQKLNTFVLPSKEQVNLAIKDDCFHQVTYVVGLSHTVLVNDISTM